MLVVVLAGAACARSGADSEPAKSDPPKAGARSIGERYQNANLEVSQLLIEADRRQFDAREFRSRHTSVTLASVKNFEAATDEMEKLAADLKKALGR